MSGSGDHDPASQRAFRAFVRRHHPDVGGDPTVFTAGLAFFGRGATRPRPPARNRDGDARFDRPIVVVHRPRGLRRLLAWLVDRHAARRRPPRVH